MRRLIRRVLVGPAVLACSVTVACDPPERLGGSAGFTIRDSADIEIVENNSSQWAEEDGWTVAGDPEIVIGGYSAVPADSSHLIWRVRDVASFSDGRVAVLSGGERRVLVFEPSGEWSRSIGRVGRGPGEYGNPEHLQILPGDTLVVWDYMFGPVSYFDPSGDFKRHWRIDVGAMFSETRKINHISPERVHLPLAGGSFLVHVNLLDRGDWTPDLGNLYRVPKALVRIDTTYAAQLFGQWEGEEGILLPHPAPPVVPFAARDQLAAGGDPLSVYVSNGDRYEVRQFSETGSLQRILRRQADPIPISAGDVDAWKESFTGSWDWDAWDLAMAKLPPREFRPPIVGLLVDSEGYLWVADRKDPARSEWSVFAPVGRWLGTVGIPLEHVEWIGEDLILGINEDPDTGVEMVQGYRLSR